ncbi:MAG TPA: helix-turn-helix domain-containing protein [Candidatus Binatia bacterium]
MTRNPSRNAAASGTRRISKRVAQGLRSRDNLLRAAARHFAERGFSATSIDDVCREAGVVKSAVYWHFASKEGLLAAVLEETATAWIEGIVASVHQTGDPRERLSRAVGGMRELVETRPALLRLLHSMLLERTADSDETREVLIRVFDRARAALVDGIAEVIGIRPPGLETTAALALAALDGIFLQHQLRKDRDELDRLFGELERMVVYLVSRLFDEAQRVGAGDTPVGHTAPADGEQEG